MAVKARNEITLVKVVDGTDGDSGIIVSSTAPSKPTVGQLWQTATGQPIKRWTGNSWVIHYISVDNLNVDTLSAIAADLGNITGGSLNINGKFIVNALGAMTAVSGKIGGWSIDQEGLSTTGALADGNKTSMNINSTTGNIKSELVYTYNGSKYFDVAQLNSACLEIYRTIEDETGTHVQTTKIGLENISIQSETGNMFTNITPEEISIYATNAGAPGVTIDTQSITGASGTGGVLGRITFVEGNKTDEVNYINLQSDAFHINGKEQPIFELVETVDLEI